jgi:hypothetical protein
MRQALSTTLELFRSPSHADHLRSVAVPDGARTRWRAEDRGGSRPGRIGRSRGFPDEPGAAATLGLIGLFFVAGELVQGAGVVWEKRYWKRTTWPSERLMLAPEGKRVVLDGALKSMIDARLVSRYGGDVKDASTSAKFALARTELRAFNLDDRSELLNARYSMSRGLVTATMSLIVVFAVAAATTNDHLRNLIALAVALVSWPFFFNRFRPFADWFARQVWRDYAALSRSDIAPPPSC